MKTNRHACYRLIGRAVHDGRPGQPMSLGIYPSSGEACDAMTAMVSAEPGLYAAAGPGARLTVVEVGR